MAKVKRKSQKLSPVHRGEILREDYMKPLGLTMNQWLLIFEFRQRESRKSFMSAGLLRRILQYALGGILVRHRGSGSIFRRLTTWKVVEDQSSAQINRDVQPLDPAR